MSTETTINFIKELVRAKQEGLQDGRASLLPRLSEYKRKYHVAKDQADYYKRKTLELNERATKAEARLEKAIKRCEEMAQNLVFYEEQLAMQHFREIPWDLEQGPWDEETEETDDERGNDDYLIMDEP